MDNKSLKIMFVSSLLVAGLALVLSLASLAFKPESVTERIVVEKEVNAGAGGSVVTNPEEHVNGITIGDVFEKWEKGRIEPGTTTSAWRNQTGGEVILDFVEVISSAVSSSTLYGDVGTSTNSAVLRGSSDYGVSGGANILGNLEFATNTRRVYNNGDETNKSFRSATSSLILADGDYVVFRLFEPATVEVPTCINGGNFRLCENASSTNRGFNLEWQLHYRKR